jgi:electron transport complex protein RnfG
MKDIVKLGGILMLITALAAAGLAAVYSVTHPRILEQKKAATERALTIALPMVEEDAIEPVQSSTDFQYYRAYKSQEKDSLAGYAFVAKGQGYSSVIETMVGVDTTGKILGMKVMSQTETPGLGTKIEQVKYGEETPWFQRQFVGKEANSVTVDKDGGEIKSITGATISSRAVANSIADGYKKLLKHVQQTGSLDQ